MFGLLSRIFMARVNGNETRVIEEKLDLFGLVFIFNVESVNGELFQVLLGVIL
jgi:hypothetical protein